MWLLGKSRIFFFGIFMSHYGCTGNSQVKLPQPGNQDRPGSGLSHQGDAQPPQNPDATGGQGGNSGEDLDVGGYSDSEKQESASSTQKPADDTQNSTSTSTATTPKPPPKGLQESERHPGQITFQNRLQPFTMTVASFVGGKTVKSQEFKLGENDKPRLSVAGLCVTDGKTCLIVTISGGVNQTAGKSACAKATIKSPTEVFINTDPDGKGLIGRCFEDATDIEDAFTIMCPQSKEVVLNECV